jgi:hypothetical protein
MADAGDSPLSWRAMKGNRVLALVAAAQLAAGLGGTALALRRRHAFDIPFWRGNRLRLGAIAC